MESTKRPSTLAVIAELYRELVEERNFEPTWWKERRRAAMERFEGIGLPARGDRAWRSTNLSALARLKALRLSAPKPAEELSPAEFEAIVGAAQGLRVVLIDGFFAPDLSSLGSDPTLSVLPFSKALHSHETLLAQTLGLIRESATSGLDALNLALCEEGLLVHVSATSAPRTALEVVHIHTRRAVNAFVQERVLVHLEADSRLTLVERHVGQDFANGAAQTVVEIKLARNSHLIRIGIEERAADSLHLVGLKAQLEQGSRFHNLSFMFGAGVARDDIQVELRGPGSECRLDGLYLGYGVRTADCRTFVDHATEQATSQQNYRGILGERSRGNFAGQISVRSGAQKSNARQSNKNLLLSSEAIADTSPELAILADDVTCSHGATVGELDEAEIFYLRSRGIDEETARALLIQGFAKTISQEVPLEDLRRSLNQRVVGLLTSSAELHSLAEVVP